MEASPSPLDFSDFEPEGYSSCQVDLPPGLSPEDYLRFAKEDLASDSTHRGAINALGNIKRAVHLQVELLGKVLGAEKLPSRDRRCFADRLEFCERCGCVGGRILERLNRIRNEVEHEYSCPDREKVEDYLDVANLFLASTERLLLRFPSEVELSNYDLILDIYPSRRVTIRMKPESGRVDIETYFLRGDPNDFRTEVAAKIRGLGWNSDLKLGSEILEQAYRQFVVPAMNHQSFSYAASQDQDYCAWVSLAIRKTT